MADYFRKKKPPVPARAALPREDDHTRHARLAHGRELALARAEEPPGEVPSTSPRHRRSSPRSSGPYNIYYRK